MKSSTPPRQIFLCGDKSYPEPDMKRFDTGDEEIPAVYTTPDGRCVFIFRRDAKLGPHFQRVFGDEIVRLAQRFNRSEWLVALAG